MINNFYCLEYKPHGQLEWEGEMKKVRVLEAMPLAKVGEVLRVELDEKAKDKGDVYNVIGKFCSIVDMDHWIKIGALEWVGEESLKEKIKKYLSPLQLISVDSHYLSQIAKQHFLEVFDKATRRGEKIFNDPLVIRKALEDA